MGKQGSERSVKSLAIFVGAAILGLVAGYLLWGRAVDWYDVPDVAKLKDSPENDLIRYGHELIADTFYFCELFRRLKRTVFFAIGNNRLSF